MKSRILLAGFLSFFSFFYGFAQTNETEPNNTAATANVVPINSSASGTITAGDVDWFQITTGGDGRIQLTISALNGADFYVRLFDHDGVTTFATVESYSNNPAALSVDGLAAGTYYAEVFPYASSTGSYTLADSLFIPAQVNDAEPNNYATQALTLGLNSSAGGHLDYHYNGSSDGSDWYKVTTTADGLLRITLSALNGADFYARLYDADTTTQLNQVESYSNNPAVLNQDGLAAGTYYIQLFPYSTSYGTYRLADSLFTPVQANDAEPNNYAKQALTLPLDGGTTGHLDYNYYKSSRDGSDWYKVTTPSDGRLRITLSALNGADFYARLYDADTTTQLNQVESYSNNPAVLSQDGLAAGTYYIQLFPYSTSYGAYTLADSLFVPAQANDKEPNNYANQADTLPVNATVSGHLDYNYYKSSRDGSDWYKITFPSNSYLRLTLSSLNGADFYARLYDIDTVTQIAQVESYGNNPAVLNADGLHAGTYYIQLFPYSTSYGTYTLADSVFAYSLTDKEPNNSPYQAPTILSNRTTTGQINFQYNNANDGVDWLKVNYTGVNGGSMNLTFTLAPHLSGGEGDIYFQVYSDTTVGPIYTTEIYGNTSSVTTTLTSLQQGYYYIKIFPYSNSFSDYSVTNSFTQVNIAAAAVKSTRPSLDSCGGNSITYALSKSHSPYGVQLYHNGVKYDSVNVVSDTARFNNLPTGNYYATVYGDGATDAAFGTSTVTVFLPPTPKGLTTSNILVHTAQLNWTPYSCVKSYSVQYRLSSATTWTTLSDANDAIGKYTLSGLTMYTNYTWRVASVDTAQGVALIGNYSDTMLFKTLSDTAIITVTKVTAGTTCNSSSIKYTSTHSVAPYTVQLYRNGAVYGSPVSSTDTTLFTGLPAGIYYATSSGTGSGGSFGTSVMDTILPPAPMGLSTTAITTTSATFNWTPLSCEHNYVIEYHKAGVSTWTMINSLANTTGTYTLNGLSTYTSYVWRIASSDSAEGKQLLSPYSDSVTFITLSNPARIVLFRSVQTNACYSDTLKYIASNSIAPYTVQLYRDSVAYGSPISVTDTAIFTGLPSGVYFATASGTGSGDTTGKSATTTLAPPFPTNLTTDSIGAMSAMLNWTPLTCVSYFTIQYKLSTSGTWTNTITVPADSSSYYVTGLTPNTTYNWRIASVDTTNGIFIVSSYSSNATFKTMNVLPVTLLSFTAKPVNNAVQVSWQTANEVNSKYFAVQRSTDGIIFTTVGTVSAFGNSTIQHQYSFTDNSPLNGTNYYRLRQVDNSGSFTDSKTITVSFAANSLFTLYPNPAVNTVHINLFVQSKAMLTVYDMNGKAVIQKVVSDGATSTQLDVSRLAAGSYMVVLQQNSGKQSITFVKQ